jgi:hypothetical protein
MTPPTGASMRGGGHRRRLDRTSIGLLLLALVLLGLVLTQVW